MLGAEDYVSCSSYAASAAAVSQGRTCPRLPDARPRPGARWRLRVAVRQLDAVGVKGKDPR